MVLLLVISLPNFKLNCIVGVYAQGKTRCLYRVQYGPQLQASSGSLGYPSWVRERLF